MQATVILDCRRISHDSAENDSQVSTSMKGNCASIAVTVIKVRSYRVYIVDHTLDPAAGPPWRSVKSGPER